MEAVKVGVALHCEEGEHFLLTPELGAELSDEHSLLVSWLLELFVLHLVSNENKTDVYLHNSLEFNFIN